MLWGGLTPCQKFGGSFSGEDVPHPGHLWSGYKINRRAWQSGSLTIQGNDEPFGNAHRIPIYGLALRLNRSRQRRALFPIILSINYTA